MLDDVTIINLMYSLGVNPETIVLTTIDSIDEEGKMIFFETQSVKYLTIILNKNLIRDLMFLKDYRPKDEKEGLDSYRSYKDKLIVMKELNYLCFCFNYL